MVNTNQNYPKTPNCSNCKNFPCTCHNSPQNDNVDNLDKNVNISNSTNEEIEIFPPSPSDVFNRTDIKPMQVLSNLEVVRDLEFHHKFISEQI